MTMFAAVKMNGIVTFVEHDATRNTLKWIKLVSE